LFLYAFFSSAHPQVRPFKEFLRLRGSAQKSAFLELKNQNVIFNVFIRKNQKKYNCAYGKKLNSSLNGHNFGCV